MKIFWYFPKTKGIVAVRSCAVGNVAITGVRDPYFVSVEVHQPKTNTV